MILDGILAAARDDDDVLDAGSNGLFDDILDHGFVHQGEHLLGLGLGGREESGPQSRGGKDGLPDVHDETPGEDAGLYHRARVRPPLTRGSGID